MPHIEVISISIKILSDMLTVQHKSLHGVWPVSMVSLLFQNGDTKYHVLVSQTGRINRLDVFYQLDFIDFIW